MSAEAPQILGDYTNRFMNKVPLTETQNNRLNENLNKRHSMPLKVTSSLSETQTVLANRYQQNDENSYTRTNPQASEDPTKLNKLRMTDSVLYRKPSEISEEKRLSGSQHETERIKSRTSSSKPQEYAEPQELNSSFRASTLDKYRRSTGQNNGEIREVLQENQPNQTIKTIIGGGRQSSVSLHQERQNRNTWQKHALLALVLTCLVCGLFFALQTILRQDTKSNTDSRDIENKNLEQTESLAQETQNFQTAWDSSEAMSSGQPWEEREELFIQVSQVINEDIDVLEQEEPHNIVIENDISNKIVENLIIELKQHITKRERIRVRDFQDDLAMQFSSHLREQLTPLLEEEIRKSNIIIYTDPDMETYYILVQNKQETTFTEEEGSAQLSSE